MASVIVGVRCSGWEVQTDSRGRKRIVGCPWKAPYTGKMGTLLRICPRCGCRNVLVTYKEIKPEEADRYFEERNRLEAACNQRKNGAPPHSQIKVVVIEREKETV